MPPLTTLAKMPAAAQEAVAKLNASINFNDTAAAAAKSSKLWDQLREVRGNDLPEDVEVDEVIPVDQPIARPDGLSPGQTRVPTRQFLRHSAGRLADDLHEPSQGELQ